MSNAEVTPLAEEGGGRGKAKKLGNGFAGWGGLLVWVISLRKKDHDDENKPKRKSRKRKGIKKTEKKKGVRRHENKNLYGERIFGIRKGEWKGRWKRMT